MIDETELETILCVSLNEFKIYLFDNKNQIILYKNNLKIENSKLKIDLNFLFKFLEENIFKIEKLSAQFIKNISLIIETNKSLRSTISLKKKNYQEVINKKKLENILLEAKDLINKNYHSEKILHILIKEFLVDNKNYPITQNDLKGDYLTLEVEFILLPNNFIFEIDKIFEKFHIRVKEYFDGYYLKDLFRENEIETPDILYKLRKGYNQNEVVIVPKNPKKLGFFEKFFQLFS